MLVTLLLNRNTKSTSFLYNQIGKSFCRPGFSRKMVVLYHLLLMLPFHLLLFLFCYRFLSRLFLFIYFFLWRRSVRISFKPPCFLCYISNQVFHSHLQVMYTIGTLLIKIIYPASSFIIGEH